MINATNARELTNQSDKEIEEIVKKLDIEIRQTALKGESVLYAYNSVPWSAERINKTPTPNYVQRRLISKLKSLGYGVSFGANGEPYAPADLVNDVGQGPVYVNHVIKVWW